MARSSNYETVDVSADSPTLWELLDEARSEDLVVRLPDGTEFLLAPVDDFDLEVARARKNEKLLAFLEARARQDETISIAEVKHRLGL
ncbi:MAG: hypothetical protein KY476_06750 [Planctomycetes bacterium]|nr:hypothetical protein [Planctomycetota bacterium]